MKRWLWGVVTGIFLTFFLVFLVGFFAWRQRSRAPEVKANSVLVIDLKGDIPEQISSDLPGRILGSVEPANFLAVIQDIQAAATDSRIQSILLKPSNLGLGWGKLEQLRSSLEEFKSKGKQVVALIGTGGTKEYFLASVANKVYLSPAGVLDLKGMRIEVMFFKDTLAKLGVQADLEHIGRYKNFSDVFTDNHLSDSFREAETALLDSIYGHFIQTVSAARKKPSEEMRILIEETGPFEADRALHQGLVDALRYEDQALEEMNTTGRKNGPSVIEMEDYHRVRVAKGGSGEHIAVVYASGTISSGEDGFDPMGGDKTMGSKSMIETLKDVEENDSIKGVILRIDSPGGDAFASDEIWRRMQSLRKKKPLVISMSDTAASGGYYIAMTGDPIVAEPGTLTGSIGIVYGKMNLKGLYDKIGINKEIISHGKFSGMDSDYASYTPEERDKVRGLMEDFYNKFVAKVAESRKMTPEAVDKIAQGRVWTGEQAKVVGLVDEVGGIGKALEILKKSAKISPEASVQFVDYPAHKTLLELLMNRADSNSALLPTSVSKILAKWKMAERFSKSLFQAQMPFAFDVR